MDDINFLGGKAQTEESFFHTFNELHDANRQLVITSGYPPQSIPLLENRLRSRLEWGLTVDIQSPDLTTRLAILDAKTKSLGVPIPANVIEYIAQRSRQSIRELEGSLNRVVAYTQLVRATPTIELASQALMDITRQLPASSAASLGQIIEVVAYSFQLTPADLVGRKRDKETALARQVAMYLLRQETKYSLEQIGDELGGRDHSTVIHACAKIAGNIGSSAELKRKIEDIRLELRSADPKPSSR
jgi:chromosomal replication initiator protein